MTIDSKNLLESILDSLNRIDYIKPADVPGIDLYMDQVTTFMDSQLQSSKRYEEDKILTKTMINNYAKNKLLPPPVKKKYSSEHLLLLLFIYYYKNLLSISDIEQLLKPITARHFQTRDNLPLGSIYQQVFSLEHSQMERLKEDIRMKFEASRDVFQDVDDQEREYLQLFAFISELSFDVYLKKQMIEMVIDQLREEEEPQNPQKKK